MKSTVIAGASDAGSSETQADLESHHDFCCDHSLEWSIFKAILTGLLLTLGATLLFGPPTGPLPDHLLYRWNPAAEDLLSTVSSALMVALLSLMALMFARLFGRAAYLVAFLTLGLASLVLLLGTWSRHRALHDCSSGYLSIPQGVYLCYRGPISTVLSGHRSAYRDPYILELEESFFLYSRWRILAHIEGSPRHLDLRSCRANEMHGSADQDLSLFRKRFLVVTTTEGTHGMVDLVSREKVLDGNFGQQGHWNDLTAEMCARRTGSARPTRRP
jgi:hypothetical protein